MRFKRWTSLSKVLTPLLSGYSLLITEDQEKNQGLEKSGPESDEKGEQETQVSGEKRGREVGEKTSQTAPSIQIATPGDSIWLFCLPTTWGTLHVLSYTDTHTYSEYFNYSFTANSLDQPQQIDSGVSTFYPSLPPSITDMNPKLLKQKT